MKFKFDHHLDLDKKMLSIVEEYDYEIYGFQKQISQRILNLEEEIVKDSLLKLGWIPPSQNNYCLYTYLYYSRNYRDVYQSECGKQIEVYEYNFCPHCGKKIMINTIKPTGE